MMRRLERLRMRIRAVRIMRARAASYHKQARHTIDPPAPAMVPEENSGRPKESRLHETAGAGAPRIARYARITWPQPDDTSFDLVPIPGHFQPSGTFLGALGRPRWPH